MSVSGDGAATDSSMQAIASRIEESEFSSVDESSELESDEVLEDDQSDLPEGDDSDDDSDAKDSEDEGLSDDYSISELLGVPDDRIKVTDDGEVLLTAIIDGQSKDVSLKELASSYQLQGHVNNKSIALENQKREFEDHKADVSKQIQDKLDSAEALSSVFENQIINEFNGIDWDRLKIEDPANWSAMRQEFQERAFQIERAKEHILQEKNKLYQEQLKERELLNRKRIDAQMQIVLQNNPSWSDPAVMESDQKAIRDFMVGTYGFSNQDLDGISDARLISLIQDAKNFREGSEKAVEKLQKNVPKFRKPGASKANAAKMAKARRAKAHIKAVRDSGGSIDSVAALIADRM